MVQDDFLMSPDLAAGVSGEADGGCTLCRMEAASHAEIWLNDFRACVWPINQQRGTREGGPEARILQRGPSDRLELIKNFIRDRAVAQVTECRQVELNSA